MKLPRSRGPYCPEVSDKTTIVMENATPATPIMEPEMVESKERAPSG